MKKEYANSVQFLDSNSNFDTDSLFSGSMAAVGIDENQKLRLLDTIVNKVADNSLFISLIGFDADNAEENRIAKNSIKVVDRSYNLELYGHSYNDASTVVYSLVASLSEIELSISQKDVLMNIIAGIVKSNYLSNAMVRISNACCRTKPLKTLGNRIAEFNREFSLTFSDKRNHQKHEPRTWLHIDLADQFKEIVYLACLSQHLNQCRVNKESKRNVLVLNNPEKRIVRTADNSRFIDFMLKMLRAYGGEVVTLSDSWVDCGTERQKTVPESKLLNIMDRVLVGSRNIPAVSSLNERLMINSSKSIRSDKTSSFMLA